MDPAALAAVVGPTAWGTGRPRAAVGSAIASLDLAPLAALAPTAAPSLGEFRRFLFMKAVDEDFAGRVVQAPVGPVLDLWNLMCADAAMHAVHACVPCEREWRDCVTRACCACAGRRARG